MNIEKLFGYKSSGQIWRLLISEEDHLVVETRDHHTKEVSFHCYNLNLGKEIFSDLQLEEKNWLGIETFYKNIIFFHKFPQKDMPGHKEIIAFDILSRKILWENRNVSFLFAHNNIIYGFKQGFEDRTFYSFDYLTGDLIQELGTDYKTINSLRQKADQEKNWNDYIYPKIFSGEESPEINNAVNAAIQDLEIEGNVEYNFTDGLLLFSFHGKVSDKIFNNRFLAVDLITGETLIDEVLNASSSSLYTDSFFVYKKFLFLLREKNEVLVYNLKTNA